MTNKDLLALIKAKYNIVSTADEDLLSEIAKTQRSIYARIKALAEKLPQANGRFIWDSKSTQINQITKTVFDSIRNSTYRNKVDAYLRKFETIEGLNKTIIGETSGISAKALKALDLSDEKKSAINDIVKRITSPDSIESNIATPISKILYQHARFGLPVSDAVEALKEFITKTEASDGIITRYIGQISRDSISQYNGVLYQSMQREYNLDAYRYVGGLVRDSRAQCVRWINHNDGILDREYLEPELAEATELILSGQRSDRFQGYSKFTMPLSFETFSIFRGGHSCLQEAIPFKNNKDNRDMIESVEV